MVGTKIGPYWLIQRLGAGAHGAVYLAEDTRLHRQVAVKTLFAAGNDPPADVRRSVLREARTAARLNHPNIAAVYDVVESPQAAHIVMEYVSGDSLATLVRHEPLPPLLAFEYAIQLADGLAAAHDRGVVHRDLKPANVMVTPEGTVKILDFGLARTTAAEEWSSSGVESSAAMPRSHRVVGTPAYIPPEHLSGDPVDARGDVYSLGVTIFETLTGRKPFKGLTPTALAASILSDPTPHAREVEPTIPPALDAIVHRAMQRQPAHRFDSAAELADALRRARQEILEEETRSQPRRWRRWVALGHARRDANPAPFLRRGKFLASVFGALFAAATTIVQQGQGSLSRPFAERRPVVAVLGLRNLSERADTAWLSTAIAEMLTFELAAGERLRMVSGDNVARMKLELSLADSQPLSGSAMAGIQRNLGVDYVVLGAYYAGGVDAGGKLRVDVEARNARDGTAVATLSDSATEAELPEVVARLGARLREGFGAPSSITTQDAERVRASLPRNPEAARLYAEGLLRLRLSDAIGARDHLRRAIQLEPAHALSHSALARSLQQLGYRIDAERAAGTAMDLSQALPRPERLWIEAQYHEVRRDWPRAVGIYRTLFTFFPDVADYGITLADAQAELYTAEGGRGALETLETVRSIPGTADNPRVDLAEANAANTLTDYRRQEAAAARAAEKAKARGARLLLARARYLQGTAAWRLGKPAAARTALEEARDLYRAVGDKFRMGRMLNVLANLRLDAGDVTEARALYEQYLAISTEVGNAAGAADALHNLGGVLQSVGDLAGAREKYEQALTLQPSPGVGQAETILEMADVIARLGDIALAQKTYERVLAMAERYGDRRLRAEALNGMAHLHYQQNELERAAAELAEAASTAAELGNQWVFGMSRIEAARIASSQGRYSAAVKAAREAAETFAAIGQGDREAIARAELARALLGTGDVAAAADAVRRAETLAASSYSLSTRVQTIAARAGLDAARGDSRGAVHRLEAAAVDARRRGAFPLELETRLLQGEIEVAGRAAAKGRARLRDLARLARIRGYARIAAEAEQAIADRRHAGR